MTTIYKVMVNGKEEREVMFLWMHEAVEFAKRCTKQGKRAQISQVYTSRMIKYDTVLQSNRGKL